MKRSSPVVTTVNTGSYNRAEQMFQPSLFRDAADYALSTVGSLMPWYDGILHLGSKKHRCFKRKASVMVAQSLQLVLCRSLSGNNCTVSRHAHQRGQIITWHFTLYLGLK